MPSPLWDEFIGQRKPSADAECLRCNLKPWRRLFAFVFIFVHAPDDATDQLYREAIVVRDLIGTAKILHVCLQDPIEDVIGRKSVLIGLIRAELGGGRLRHGCPW